MGQSATAPSEAFLESYYQGYNGLIALQKKPFEDITTVDLHEVGAYLMQAIEIDPTQVQPYVLLAAMFLSVNQQALVTKYLDLAEAIDPEFPGLLSLKEHMMTPPSLRKKHKHATQAAVPSIQRLGRLREPLPPSQTAADSGKEEGFNLLSFPEV